MKLTRTRYLMMFIACLLVLVPAVMAQDPETPTPDNEPTVEPTMEATIETEAETSADTDADTVDPAGAETYIRFAHFAPQVDDVDVLLNNEPVNDEVLGYTHLTGWIPLESSVASIAVVPAGQTVNEAVISFDDVELGRGFVTVIVLPDASGQASLYAISRGAEDLLPGTSGVTFINALTTDTPVNFDRDGVPFASELGNSTNRALYIPVDSDTYTFSAYNPFSPENTFGSETEIELIDGSYYVIAVVGTEDDAQFIVHETTGAEVAIATGVLAEPGTINQAILSREDLVEYEDVFNRAGLTEMFSGEGPYTLLLPAGFLIDEINAAVGNDADLLASTLQNHAIEGNITLTQLSKMQSVTTMAGNTYDVVVEDNTISVGGLRVLVPNMFAINGVVHVIDGILETP